MLSGTRASIAIKVFGDDLTQLRASASAIEKAMKGIEGVVDLAVEQQVDVPQLTVKFDREAIARYGLRAGVLAETIETAYAGTKVTQVLENQRTYDKHLFSPVGHPDEPAVSRSLCYAARMRILAIVLALAIGGACSKSTPASKTPIVNDPLPMSDATASPSASSSPAPSSATAVLASYERVRAALAADDTNAASGAARDLESSARAEAASSKHFAAIAESASKLAAAADIKTARSAFGEVSQHLVALLASDKSLAAGQNIFECPMVKGYNKWVQPTKNLENPYMGKRMLTCGGESSWE